MGRRPILIKTATTRTDNLIITSRIKLKVDRVIKVNRIRVLGRVKRVKIIYWVIVNRGSEKPGWRL